ncbi:MAG: cupin domain-containing protein [Gammaproteobacteria bacterium]|nr:cupin domain-containing protein [Gammaproteobacteria bacterium]MDH3465301.1 cupin domain-containing protein [Gammaproteobacteria bacterium]
MRETPGYRVIDGDPRASVRFDRGSADSAQRLGVWMCTPGTFECVESGDELQTVLEGKLSVTQADGTVHEFTSGDSFYTDKGERLIWEIVQTVKKVFFAYNRDGAL